MEDWAEIRRLHRAEGVPIKAIARRLGSARNTVRAALASDRPSSERGRRGSLVDAVEPQIRALLAEFPRMPATVIAERIGWAQSIRSSRTGSGTDAAVVRRGDPADRIVYEPGRGRAVRPVVPGARRSRSGSGRRGCCRCWR